MAAEVLPTPQVRLPQTAAALTSDQRYWSSFSNNRNLPVPNSAPITFLSSNAPAASPFAYSSVTPPAHYISVTTGPRLLLLSPQTLKTVRTIARTSSSFHGATIRSDGRLILVGSDTGSVQAFDVSSRAILKSWSEHKQPVWVSAWHPRSLTSIMSCSDDTTVRLWDLPSEESTWKGYGHTDYVRSGGFLSSTGSLLVSGSYDRTVKIWDPRIESGNACVQTFQMPDPVEAVLPLPGGTSIVASSGEKIAVLDLVAARPLHLLKNHQKTVTSISLASKGTRLLSGGLDGHVKVFDTANWTVVSGFKYPSPILSLTVTATSSGEDRNVCVGMQSGTLAIRTKLSPTQKAARRAREKEMEALMEGEIEEHDRKVKKAEKRKLITKGVGWQARIRGKDFVGESGDIIVAPNIGRLKSRSRKAKASNIWDQPLRAARYPEALDNALATHDRAVVLTVLTALVHRSAVRAALQGRTAKTLLPVIRWLQRHIADPTCVNLAVEVSNVVLDEYADNVPESQEVEEALVKLQEGVRRGLECVQMCLSTVGMLELLRGGEHPGQLA